ncbi:hypothetical protein DE146DRAFT_434700 [Phaeosphaeria sp. MPI-PUGE-AT-0046c]|nr:hypothetical protein DE146DRAFT_434700 [Phaeosphaeria sp. MPI-PUGE-AT-0046c]
MYVSGHLLTVLACTSAGNASLLPLFATPSAAGRLLACTRQLSYRTVLRCLCLGLHTPRKLLHLCSKNAPTVIKIPRRNHPTTSQRIKSAKSRHAPKKQSTG